MNTREIEGDTRGKSMNTREVERNIREQMNTT